MTTARPPEGTAIWIEIPATGDVDESKTFYKTVFSTWEFHAPYSDIQVSGYQMPKGLGGGIVKMPEGCAPSVQQMGRGLTIYYSVTSLADTQKKVQQLGGSTCLEKTKQGEFGYFMNFLDPQGNRFGAYEFV